MSADRARELRDALVNAIGFLEAGLVHAHTAAFQRIPALFERLGPDFRRDPEVLEVATVVRRLLHERERRGISPERERAALRRLEAQLDE